MLVSVRFLYFENLLIFIKQLILVDIVRLYMYILLTKRKGCTGR